MYTPRCYVLNTEIHAHPYSVRLLTYEKRIFHLCPPCTVYNLIMPSPPLPLRPHRTLSYFSSHILMIDRRFVRFSCIQCCNRCHGVRAPHDVLKQPPMIATKVCENIVVYHTVAIVTKFPSIFLCEPGALDCNNKSLNTSFLDFQVIVILLGLGIAGVAVYGLVVVPKGNTAVQDGWSFVIKADRNYINQVRSFFDCS